jgi:hypothetical protein
MIVTSGAGVQSAAEGELRRAVPGGFGSRLRRRALAAEDWASVVALSVMAALPLVEFAARGLHLAGNRSRRSLKMGSWRKVCASFASS